MAFKGNKSIFIEYFFSKYAKLKVKQVGCKKIAILIAEKSTHCLSA